MVGTDWQTTTTGRPTVAARSPPEHSIGQPELATDHHSSSRVCGSPEGRAPLSNSAPWGPGNIAPKRLERRIATGLTSTPRIASPRSFAVPAKKPSSWFDAAGRRAVLAAGPREPHLDPGLTSRR